MKQILELFTQPAFLVADGIVTWRNHAAYALITEGTPLQCILEGHGALHAQWDGQGTIQIPLLLAGENYDATVCKTELGELFVASEARSQWTSGAAAMINASASLRRPLQNMVMAADTIFHQIEETETWSSAASKLNRSMYQMLRLCGQMSDGGRLLLQRFECHKESTDVNAFFTEFSQQIGPMIERGGWKFRLIPLEGRVRADVDQGLVERALYNLLSNAMLYTPKGGEITISLRRNLQQVFVCVSDSGEGVAQDCISTVFERIVEHASSDPRKGLGMGLQMVREIARLHGGTMMFSGNGEAGGTSVTFSLSLDRAPLTLKSRTVRYDCYGGFHHALVELSDVLDAEYFDPKEV